MAPNWSHIEACARDVLSDDRVVRSGIRDGSLTIRAFRNRVGARMGWTPEKSKRELKGYKQNFVRFMADTQSSMQPSPLSSSGASSQPRRLQRLRRHKRNHRPSSMSDVEDPDEYNLHIGKSNRKKRLRKRIKGGSYKKNQRKVWNEIEYVDDEAEVDGSASEDEDNDYSADEDQISQLVDDTSIQEEQEGFHAAVDAKSGRDSLVALGRGAKRLRRGGILRAAMTFNNSPTTFERAYQRGELDTPSQTPSSLPSSRYLDTDDEDDDVEIIDTPTSGLNAGENISSFSEKPNSLVLDLTEDTPFLKRARKLSNNCSNQKNRLVLDLISPNQPRRSIQPQPTYLNMSHPPQMRPAIIQSTSNSALSDDQRRRIEENRKAALLRRQQRKINTPPPQDSYFGNSLYYDHGWNSTK